LATKSKALNFQGMNTKSPFGGALHSKTSPVRTTPASGYKEVKLYMKVGPDGSIAEKPKEKTAMQRALEW
jgi:hypothetical protein